MEFLLALAIIVLVAAFVTVPLRRRAGWGEGDPFEAERAELDARKQVKYREIRDAEADRASGKLSEEDFARLDRELRAEAIAILRRLDKLDRDEESRRPAG
ncbi:MAG TPA: hypothetical protein VHH72_00240 [Solirubrobacterales bacterium]|jgi:hypothetical protein|nr:hypothetical protein [Solirubrobacterales bacterium]